MYVLLLTVCRVNFLQKSFTKLTHKFGPTMSSFLHSFLSEFLNFMEGKRQSSIIGNMGFVQ